MLYAVLFRKTFNVCFYFISFIIETIKSVQQLKAVLHNLTVRLQWKAPDVFIPEVDGYKISYM